MIRTKPIKSSRPLDCPTCGSTLINPGHHRTAAFHCGAYHPWFETIVAGLLANGDTP